MHLPALSATGIALCIVLGLTSSAQSQSPPACPYANGLPSVVCNPNPTPDTIPAGIPGNLLTSAECTNVQIDAIASMHSYDDVSCHSVGTLLPHFSKLKFVRDGADILPDNWKRINEAKDFRAALYCDISTNTLILAFRGSISLTAMSRNDIYDWYFTNFAQHMGDRPLQYQGAEDAAQLVKRELGNYSDVCGPGQPRLLLTGHSKGGGQAQDAATKQKLEAVVFNSDLVNPIIFSDWMLEPPWYLEPFIEAIRAFYSLRACVLGDHDDDVQQYIEYFATGRIRDVRMVNDPLTRVLFLACQNNLPHASIEWLSDTLTCSSNGLLAGHMIDNVARELQACTQTNIVDPVKKKP